MATVKQNKAIEEFTENPTQPLGKTMRKAGFSQLTSENPKNLTTSKAWKDFIQTIDDDAILKRIEDFALNDEDKNLALNSAKEVFKIKNRYPTATEQTTTPQLNILVKELVVEGGREVDQKENSS